MGINKRKFLQKIPILPRQQRPSQQRATRARGRTLQPPVVAVPTATRGDSPSPPRSPDAGTASRSPTRAEEWRRRVRTDPVRGPPEENPTNQNVDPRRRRGAQEAG